MGFWKYVLGTPRNYALTLLEEEEPPECIHKATCKKCAYYEYCYV